MALNGNRFCGIYAHLFESLLDSQFGAQIYFEGIAGKYFNSVNTDTKLTSCIKSISKIYHKCLGDICKRTDWNNSSNRRAYMCRFFAMHSYMVYCGLQKSLAKHAFITDGWRDTEYYFGVCCVGGGPGSDVVGLVKFLKNSSLIPEFHITCTIFDLHIDWKSEWEQIQLANPNEFLVNVKYLQSNLILKGGSLCSAGLASVRSADIITMIKFYSTVDAFIKKDPAQGNILRQIFREMKPGALVLYIDNCFQNRHEEFQLMASSGGVNECLFEWHGPLQMCMPDTHSTTIHRITQTTGVEPMKIGKVSILLLRKPI